MKIRVLRALAIGGLGLLAACGGGGGDDDGGGGPTGPTPDTTPPTITVNGDTAIDLAYASEYEDEGASATDETDGEVDVTVSGDVDPFTPGTYTLTYTATDAAGNEASAERVVTVANQQYRLDVSNFGAASVAVSSGTLACSPGGDACSASIDADTDVTVTVTPDSGWTFDSWLGCDSVSANECTVTMDEDLAVFATSSSDEAVTLKTDVQILSDGLIDAIINYNAGSDIVFFAAGTDVSSLGIGTVMVSQGSDANDIYFAKRIVDIIQLTGSPIVVETINVSLEEIVSSGTVIATTDISAASVDDAALPAGMSVDRTRASADSIPLTVVNLPVFDSGGVTVSVTGDLVVSFDPNIAAHFTESGGLQAFRFAGDSSIDADLAVNMSGEIDTPLSFDEEFSLASIPVGTIIAGPAVFLIELEPVVTFNSSLEVTVEPAVSVQQASALGAQWHAESGWTNLSDFSIAGGFTLAEPPAATIKADAGGGLKPSAKLYGLVGPFLKATVYGGGEYTLVASDDCRLAFREYVGGRASVGGEFDRVSRRLRLRVESDPRSIETTTDSGTIECPADTVAPDEPAGLAVSAVSDTELGLSWEAATDNVAVSSYEVWRAQGSGRAVRVAIASATTYLDTGLTAETEYCYYVIAVDAGGNRSGIPSQTACGTTLEPADTELPTVPSGLTITDVTSSSMTLGWTASTDNDAVLGYVIYDEGLDRVYGDVGTVTAFTARPLNPETEYCYSVAAVDASGNQSARSQAACATTEPAANAGWTAFLGCVGREFQIEQNFDLPTEGISAVEFAGSGFDYPGTPLTYVFQGTYNAGNGDFSSDIVWAFEGQSQQRADRFAVNLATGDSGVVPMSFVVDNGGCDAQIQIISNEGSAEVAEVSAPAAVSVSADARGKAFGQGSR